MQYSLFPGTHGTDLLPTFFSPSFIGDSSPFLEALSGFVLPALMPIFSGISNALQSYFASFITTGDPNAKRSVLNVPPTIRWDHPTAGEAVHGVLNVGDWGFSAIVDTQYPKTACDFWVEFGAAVTSLGGYAPPGGVLTQSLVEIPNDPSRRYNGGNGG